MQIYEVYRKYGISRKTVHYYIQCGLLHPSRGANQHYRFENDDLQDLERILRLRKAGISIENIQDIIRYPACCNFFLYRQRFSLRQQYQTCASQIHRIDTLFE